MSTSVKEREHAGWSHVASGWAKHDEHLKLWQSVVSEKMLAVTNVSPGQRVLDIASGTGEPAIPAAERVGPTGSVLGTDFVPGMLAAARDKAAKKGLGNIEFKQVDGEQLEVPDGSFDVVLCRWGIIFMPDPAACLRHAYAALKPGGRIAVAAWAPPDKNPWASVPMSVLRRHLEFPAPPPGAPGLFAFADPNRLRSVHEEVGFTDVVVEPVALEKCEFSDGASFFTYMRELAAPIAALMAQAPPAKHQEIERDISSAVEVFRTKSGTLLVPGVSWVAHGRKP